MRLLINNQIQIHGFLIFLYGRKNIENVLEGKATGLIPDNSSHLLCNICFTFCAKMYLISSNLNHPVYPMSQYHTALRS